MKLNAIQKNYLGKISREVNYELQHKHYTYNFPEFSLQLVSSIHYLYKLQAFVLMKSLLRFSDAKSISLRKAVTLGHIETVTQKTKKNIVIPFQIFEPRLESMLIALSFYPQIWDYVGLSNELRYKLRDINFPLDFGGKALTHVFRHLQASYLYSKEFPLSYISELLGDSESITKNYYIHDRKKFFFLN